MSFDLKIINECTHRVIDEIHALEPDRRTVHFNRPPSTSKDVIVKVNGYTVDSESETFGYRLLKDPTKLDDSLMLEFKKDLQDENPMLELSYTTLNTSCRRCNSTKREYDPKPGPNGEYRFVFNEELLAQIIEKWEVTEEGSNEWQPPIGTPLVKMVGGKSADEGLIQSILSDSFNTMAALIQQTQRRQSTYQIVDPREVLDRILEMSIEQDSRDTRLWRVQITFETVDGTIAYIER